MYLPTPFEETRDDELSRIIATYPLGALVMNGPQGLDANHLPFLLDNGDDGRRRLLAHVARANPLWQDAHNGDEALVIFRGEDAYVSPNWYPSKHEFHRQVPTWNYQVVHVHGKLFIHDSERFVRGLVARLTRVHEAQTGAARPWKMSDSSPDYIDQMLSAIVGIEIEITRIAGKTKLSQNREQRDRRGVAEELSKRGNTVMAAAMLNRDEPP
jgi:transcriptional regulator